MTEKEKLDIETIIKKHCYIDINAYSWRKDSLIVYARSGNYHIEHPTQSLFLGEQYKQSPTFNIG